MLNYFPVVDSGNVVVTWNDYEEKLVATALSE